MKTWALNPKGFSYLLPFEALIFTSRFVSSKLLFRIPVVGFDFFQADYDISTDGIQSNQIKCERKFKNFHQRKENWIWAPFFFNIIHFGRGFMVNPYLISFSKWRHITSWNLINTGLVNNVLLWWRHQMETFSVLLALYAGNSPVTDEFPSQRPMTWSFDVFVTKGLYSSCSSTAAKFRSSVAAAASDQMSV